MNAVIFLWFFYQHTQLFDKVMTGVIFIICMRRISPGYIIYTVAENSRSYLNIM